MWQVIFVLLEDSAIAARLDIHPSEEGEEEVAVQRLPLESSDGSTQIDNGGEAFVNDANLVSSSSIPQHPHEVSWVDQKIQCVSAVKNLQVYAQQWERALFSTGGAINFSKSFWFVFNWKWSGGIARLLCRRRLFSCSFRVLKSMSALPSGNNFSRHFLFGWLVYNSRSITRYFSSG
jgi:hypothetical protein